MTPVRVMEVAPLIVKEVATVGEKYVDPVVVNEMAPVV